MRPHGGYQVPRLAPRTIAGPLSSITPPGYRNLFGRVSEKDRFQGYGFGKQQVNETSRLLKALAYRMCCQFQWKSKLVGGPKDEDNPNLPAGYTYLAQFIAHDLSFVAPANPNILARPLKGRNFRSAALELDTLYGGGPSERPLSYCAGDLKSARSPLLRLGYFQADGEISSLPEEEQRRRARELPRACARFHNDRGAGLVDVLIADPRNDDQPVVGQIFVLFALLHNAVCDRLPLVAKSYLAMGDDDLFGAARKVVTSVYKRIITKDFLQRLLNPSIYQRYIIEQAE